SSDLKICANGIERRESTGCHRLSRGNSRSSRLNGFENGPSLSSSLRSYVKKPAHICGEARRGLGTYIPFLSELQRRGASRPIALQSLPRFSRHIARSAMPKMAVHNHNL